MKKYQYHILICVLLFSCKAKKASTLEIPLQSVIITKDKLGAERNISILLKADTIQRSTKEGLKFAVKVINRSDKSVVINNLLDFLNFNLSKIPLRSIDGEDIINFTSRERAHQDKFDLSNSSVRIESVEMNDKQVLEDILEVKSITIPAKGEYEVTFRVPQILKNNAVKPYNVDQLIPIIDGRYRLFLIQRIKFGENYSFSKEGTVYILYGKK